MFSAPQLKRIPLGRNALVDDLETGAKVILSGQAARRFWRAFIAFFALSTVGIIIVGEIGLRRWAPWASNTGMSVVVAWVWMYHMLAVVRRQQPVIVGVARAVGYSLGVGALVVGALYVVRG